MKTEYILLCDDGNFTYCPSKESVTNAVQDFIFDGPALEEGDSAELDSVLFKLFADGEFQFEGDPTIRLFRLE